MNSDERPGTGVMNPSPTGWRKSSHSSVNANCVEINTTHADLIHIRDSKDHGTGPTINVTSRQWSTFLNKIASTMGPTAW